MRFTYEPEYPDGSPRLYAGMHRPPRISNPGGYVHCLCGSVLQTMQQVESHYQSGHFDSALYQLDVDEQDVVTVTTPDD